MGKYRLALWLFAAADINHDRKLTKAELYLHTKHVLEKGIPVNRESQERITGRAPISSHETKVISLIKNNNLEDWLKLKGNIRIPPEMINRFKNSAEIYSEENLHGLVSDETYQNTLSLLNRALQAANLNLDQVFVYTLERGQMDYMIMNLTEYSAAYATMNPIVEALAMEEFFKREIGISALGLKDFIYKWIQKTFP